MRIASSPYRIAFIALLILAACGGGGSEGGSTPGETESAGKEKPVTEQGKKWSGWRWKGRRDDCFFLYRNECYSSLADACQAAGCKKPDCEHDESAPAKVSCQN